MSIEIGVILPTSTPDPAQPILGDVRESARFAEEAGLDSVWSTDHVIASAPILDSTVVLATAAAVTGRVKIGFGVMLADVRFRLAGGDVLLLYTDGATDARPRSADGDTSPLFGQDGLAIRKVMTGSVPSLLTISALVLTVQTAVALATGEPAGTFLMLCTVTTIALTVAGTGASALWFLAVLRKLGLRLRFAPA